MNTRLLIFFGISILIIGLILGFSIGKGCSKPCPEIKVGKDTILVEVIVHDTITSYQTRDSIKIIKQVKTIFDTIFDTIQNVQIIDSSSDSTNCYNFHEFEKDGAFIEAKICSDSFPEEKPLDLNSSIIYLPPPDSLRTIFRIDTILKSTPQIPIYKDWKFYVGITLMFVSGFITANKI